MKTKSIVILCTLFSLLCLPLQAESVAQQRIWTKVAAVTLDCKARDIQKGIGMGKPGGPDSPITQNFQVPSRGLLRVTQWIDPYYGQGRRDINYGGAGVGPAKGDGSAYDAPHVYRYCKPEEPTDGVPWMKCTIGEVEPRAAFVEVTPAVAASHWAQLRCTIRVLVEFSPGTARPEEKFGPPSAPPGSTAATPKTDFTQVVGSWKVDANGYPGVVEVSGAGANVSVRMYYEITKRWEAMTNAKFSPESGEISFTRPWAGNPIFQQYRGKVIDGRIVGTFIDNNSPGQQFKWTGQR